GGLPLAYVGRRFALINRNLIAKVSNAVLPILESSGKDLKTWLDEAVQAYVPRVTPEDSMRHAQAMATMTKTLKSYGLLDQQINHFRSTVDALEETMGIEAATRHAWHINHVFGSDVYGVKTDE